MKSVTFGRKPLVQIGPCDPYSNRYPIGWKPILI